MTLLVDTHAFHWWLAEPERLSPAAGLALSAADELVVASITWFELGWMAVRGRIGTVGPIGAWLQRLAQDVRTIGLTPSIAALAAALPASFPSDPADRIIYATAVEHGWQLVSKDAAMRAHPSDRPMVIW
jgi:PIN domain nuclease of toxin-antitoxin system